MSKNKPSIRKAIIGAASIGVALTCLSISSNALAEDAEMTFFITSTGPGKGGDLGGLEGADKHCTTLAAAAGSKLTNWKAYLSVNAKIERTDKGAKVIPGVNARDRIGTGPWVNAKSELIAENIEQLHSDTNNISKEIALDENGKPIKARGDKPNQHDILTGSTPAGEYSTAGGDTTCSGWTSSDKGSAIVGHHDKVGLSKDRHMVSWNSAHGSAGCSAEALPKTGGNGLFYCFHAGK